MKWHVSSFHHFPRSTTWLFRKLHSGLLLGWSASYGWSRGAIFCASRPFTTPAARGCSIGRGDVHHCSHVAHCPKSTGAQELHQWRNPPRLQWRRDTHLSCSEERFKCFTNTHTKYLNITAFQCLIFKIGLLKSNWYIVINCFNVSVSPDYFNISKYVFFVNYWNIKTYNSKKMH